MLTISVRCPKCQGVLYCSQQCLMAHAATHVTSCTGVKNKSRANKLAELTVTGPEKNGDRESEKVGLVPGN